MICFFLSAFSRCPSQCVFFMQQFRAIGPWQLAIWQVWVGTITTDAIHPGEKITIKLLASKFIMYKDVVKILVVLKLQYYVFICISYILTCELLKTLSSDSKKGSQWQIEICDRLPVDLYKKVILVIHLTNKSFMLLDFLALNAGTLYVHIHQILLYVLYDFSLEKSHLWETSVS